MRSITPTTIRRCFAGNATQHRDEPTERHRFRFDSIVSWNHPDEDGKLGSEVQSFTRRSRYRRYWKEEPMADLHPLSRRKTLEEWESWVDKAINDARERGEFDNLPGHGMPLQLDVTPFAGCREIGFGILKNAGMAPYWVEVNKEIITLSTELDALRNRANEIAFALRAGSITVQPEPEQVAKRRWWQLFRYVEPPRRQSRAEQDELNRSELARLRWEYLAQSELLNQKIAHYNASIPRDLWQLAQQTPSLADAEREFDEACR